MEHWVRRPRTPRRHRRGRRAATVTDERSTDAEPRAHEREHTDEHGASTTTKATHEKGPAMTDPHATDQAERSASSRSAERLRPHAHPASSGRRRPSGPGPARPSEAASSPPRRPQAAGCSAGSASRRSSRSPAPWRRTPARDTAVAHRRHRRPRRRTAVDTPQRPRRLGDIEGDERRRRQPTTVAHTTTRGS